MGGARSLIESLQTNSPADQSGRIEVIDGLRGLAALAVCWHHLTFGNGGYLPDGFVQNSGWHGYLGVAVFFVISGFIIPYTLYKSAYRLRNYGTFVLKRVVRLDPPYFASIALVLAVGYLLMKFAHFKHGAPPFQSWQQLVFHIGYLNAVLHYPWLNDVYWTLAIEFQYYLLLGLVYPALSGRRAIAVLIVVSCVLAFIIRAPSLVFQYLPWFCFGIVTYKYVTKQLRLAEYLSVICLLFAFTYYVDGILRAGVLIATSVVIAFVRIRIGRVASFFGAISYSLYLTHIPVGLSIINLSEHFNPSYQQKLLALVVAFVASVVSAYLLYILVERPSLRLASRLRFRRLTPAAAVPIRP